MSDSREGRTRFESSGVAAAVGGGGTEEEKHATWVFAFVKRRSGVHLQRSVRVRRAFHLNLIPDGREGVRNLYEKGREVRSQSPVRGFAFAKKMKRSRSRARN